MSSETDLLRTVAKYKHIVAVAAAIVFLAVALPPPQRSSDVTATGTFDENGLPTSSFDGSAGSLADGGTGTAGEVTDPARSGGTSGGGQGESGGQVIGGGATSGASDAAPGTVDPTAMGPHCDPATGRIALPTIYAPPCVPAFSGDNGGSTSSGVTRDAIKIVYYRTPNSAATTAALTAAGAANSWEDTLATFRNYVKLFSAYYETYGRKIEIVVKEPSGQEGDDAAAQADAVDIATRIKPFLVMDTSGGTVPNAFAQTLASRGVICVCGVSQPQEYYQGRSPFLGYTILMSSTQGYTHRAEYVCKRLGHNLAVHAGFRDSPADPMSDEKRSYGIMYYETEDKAYKAGVDYFEKLLASCGIKLTTRLEYLFDPSSIQEQASTMISRLKADGVTSIVYTGDPISAAVFTKEATRQRWYPEWIVTGAALTDTNLFARTYDQTQWRNAFGISFLPGLFDSAKSDPYYLHSWYFGSPPPADNVAAVIHSTVLATFTGIHLAGPTLTPATFQRGLFSFPPTGGGPTAPLLSYGSHGIWQASDFTGYDDVSEIWWDPQAVGPDQVGNQGTGMYRYVDNGRRFLPGQQPTSAPNVFTTANAPTYFDQRPSSDVGPDYPSPAGR